MHQVPIKSTANRKTVENVPEYVSKQMHIFIKYSGGVEMNLSCKRRYSKDLQQPGLEISCMFPVSSEHEKCYPGLKNVNILSKKLKSSLVHNLTYSGAH